MRLGFHFIRAAGGCWLGRVSILQGKSPPLSPGFSFQSLQNQTPRFGPNSNRDYIYNHPWKNLYKIDHLEVRFYRDEAGRPVFTIEWYMDCAHPVYIPKSDTKLEALQAQFSILQGVFFLITWTHVFILQWIVCQILLQAVASMISLILATASNK